MPYSLYPVEMRLDVPRDDRGGNFRPPPSHPGHRFFSPVA